LDVPISQLWSFQLHSGISHGLSNNASLMDANFSPEELPKHLLPLKGQKIHDQGLLT
jgi:hypothetical protein